MHFKFKDRLKVGRIFSGIYHVDIYPQEEITTVTPDTLQSKASYYSLRHTSQNDFSKIDQPGMAKDSRCVCTEPKDFKIYDTKPNRAKRERKKSTCMCGEFKTMFCAKDTAGHKCTAV